MTSGDGFDAREYLIRNALQPAFPGISPLPTLAGVCAQVDHILAGQQDAIAQAYVLLWSIVTDDPRQHRARHILLDAMGGQGSTRQKLAMEKYGAECNATHDDMFKAFAVLRDANAKRLAEIEKDGE